MQKTCILNKASRSEVSRMPVCPCALCRLAAPPLSGSGCSPGCGWSEDSRGSSGVGALRGAAGIVFSHCRHSWAVPLFLENFSLTSRGRDSVTQHRHVVSWEGRSWAGSMAVALPAGSHPPSPRGPWWGGPGPQPLPAASLLGGRTRLDAGGHRKGQAPRQTENHPGNALV